MNDSFDWILEEVKKYIAEKRKYPAFISDWDSDIHENAYPHSLIKKSLQNSIGKSRDYVFPEDQIILKEKIEKYIQLESHANLTTKNISLLTNSTSALYLSLVSLKKMGISRFLVITPAYYSVLDTLADLNAAVIYCHLVDSLNFQIDAEKVKSLIDEQFIQAVIITDPVYSSGVNIDNSIYECLADFFNAKKIWVIIDGTLGNMYWGEENYFAFDIEKINSVSKIKQFVYIDSVTKRFQVNGIKSAVVLAHESIIPFIEDIGCQISGGLCSAQVQLLSEFLSPENNAMLTQNLRSSLKVISQNYNLLQTSLIGSGFSVYKSENGYFTSVYSTQKKIKDVNIQAVVKSFLYGHDLRILPTSCLGFCQENLFGIRVNLLKDIKPLIPVILSAIGKNFN
jgi:aspartate/methionine/tyrosine aminotransferase